MESAIVDDLDLKIIHALHVNHRGPFALFSEVLGASEQTIARRYRRLHEARIVRVVGQLNAQRLGRSDWAVRIRCIPGASPTVAARLAVRSETSWVQLASGGTEIFCTVHSDDRGRRTPLLLGQISAGREVVGFEAYCLLHIFTSDLNQKPLAVALAPEEVERLQPLVATGATSDGAAAAMDEADWPLVAALVDDGRATYRKLAAATNWHESTVRRRVDDLVASGVLYFDLDVDVDALGVRSRALLWLSVVPSRLIEVGEHLAARPEIPFVAATSGPTNLVASLACRDDHALFEYLTREIAVLDGVTHIETAPIMHAVKMHATLVSPGRRSAV